MLAVAAEPGQRAVVERRFEDVAVFAVEIEVQHALRPEDQRHRGAGLGVGRLVGQVVVEGEAFIVRRGTEPGRHVHLGGHDVGPQRLQRPLERRVASLEREVGHAGIKVHGAHGVADDLVLLAHRAVRLAVFVVRIDVALLEQAAAFALGLLDVEIMRRVLAALIDEVGGEVEVLLVAGEPVELHQRQLDLGVPAIALALTGVRPEGAADELDVTLHDVEPAPAAGGLEIGDRAFEHVAGVVELVVVAQVGPAVLGLAVEIPAVEVAVGGLGRLEIVDDGLDAGFDRGVAAMRQRVARRLDPFADVGIPEHLHGKTVGVARKAQRRWRLRQLQGTEIAVLGQLLVLARDGRAQHGLEALLPEVAFEPDIDEAQRGVLRQVDLRSFNGRWDAKSPERRGYRAAVWCRFRARRRSWRGGVARPPGRAR